MFLGEWKKILEDGMLIGLNMPAFGAEAVIFFESTSKKISV